MLFSKAVVQAVAALALFAGVALADGSVANPPLVNTPTPPPASDPFMVIPADIANYKPGTILRARQLPVSGTTVNGSASAVYQLFYASRDSNNKPTAITVTLFAPQKAVAQPTKHVSLSSPYDSANVICESSYNIQNGAMSGSIVSLTATDTSSINHYLAQGYYVSTSDYEGPQAAFINGVQSGRAVLDSIRAVTSTQIKYGLASTAQTVLVGYSGGALAGEWATELRKAYAPEVKISGAAIGGLTPNVTSVAYTINKSAFAGLTPAGIWGIAAQSPALTNYINQHVLPSKNATFQSAKGQCAANDFFTFAFQDIFSYFDGGSELITGALPQSVVNAVGIMGLHGTPDVPLFIYKGVNDQISVVADTDSLVAKYCKAGANISYLRFSDADHVSAQPAGQPKVWAAVDSFLNGVKLPAGCKTVTQSQFAGSLLGLLG